MLELDYGFSPEISINREEHWGQDQLNAWAHYIRTDCICSTASHSTKRAVIDRQPRQMDKLKIVDFDAGLSWLKSFKYLWVVLLNLRGRSIDEENCLRKYMIRAFTKICKRHTDFTLSRNDVPMWIACMTCMQVHFVTVHCIGNISYIDLSFTWNAMVKWAVM